MNFKKEKNDFLRKIDKSKKRKIDKKIEKIVAYINSLQNYYTSSSCSGRIVLIEKKSTKKYDAKWLFISHGITKYNKIKKSLKILSKNPVWFKQESAIVHVCCKTIDDAKKLIQIARDSGLKRAGIISIGKKITVEIIGTENIETLVVDKGKLLVDDNYLKKLVAEANKKLKINLKNINKFYYRLVEGI